VTASRTLPTRACDAVRSDRRPQRGIADLQHRETRLAHHIGADRRFRVTERATLGGSVPQSVRPKAGLSLHAMQSQEWAVSSGRRPPGPRNGGLDALL
jgi:hypothetical protein